MHTHFTTNVAPGPVTDPVRVKTPRCGFAFCPELSTRRVETRTPIGRRIEWLCMTHAQRRAELEEVLSDEPLAALPEPATRRTDPLT